MTKIVLLALAAFAIATSQASAASAPYRTPAQAEHWLTTGPTVWAGIKIAATWRTAWFKNVSCSNGDGSVTENRTGHHFPQGKVNRFGEDVYRSFVCYLSLNSRGFRLYLVTTPTGWSVKADR